VSVSCVCVVSGRDQLSANEIIFCLSTSAKIIRINFEMVKRLLSALEYPQCDSVNINDVTTFRKIVVWLEQNKIQKASPNVQNGLKNIASGDWPNNFVKYKEELGCPNLQTPQEQLQWLLGFAVQVETHNKSDLYVKHAVENLQSTNVPSVVAENPLDKLNCECTGIGIYLKLNNAISYNFQSKVKNLQKELQM
jgi:hypothetical protein